MTPDERIKFVDDSIEWFIESTKAVFVAKQEIQLIGLIISTEGNVLVDAAALGLNKEAFTSF